MAWQCTSACPALPIREAKRGGRSRPPPISPIGTDGSEKCPQPQEGQRDRGIRVCKSADFRDVSRALCLSYTSGSARRNPFLPPQKPCRSPSGIAVDCNPARAIFYQRLQLDCPLQCGRHSFVGVEYGRLPREDGVFDAAVFVVRRWVPRSSLRTRTGEAFVNGQRICQDFRNRKGQGPRAVLRCCPKIDIAHAQRVSNLRNRRRMGRVHWHSAAIVPDSRRKRVAGPSVGANQVSPGSYRIWSHA